MPIIISEAKESDLEGCINISRTRELILPNGKYPDLDYLKEIIGKVFFFIGRQSEKIVGFIIGHPLAGGSCFIDILAVSKEDRGKGYGSKLLKHLIKKCRDEKISYVFLFASNINPDTLDFYKQSGFLQSSNAYSFFCKGI